MRAVVYHGAREVSVEEVPDARIERPTDVLVKVTSTCICGSDLHMYEGRTSAEAGKVLGHESVGEVVEIGPAVDRIKVGDRVCVPFNIACGFCRNCERGETAYCLTTNPGQAGAAYGYAGMGPYRGGQAELLRVPYGDVNCLRLPPDAADRENDYAMLADVFPTGYHATELAGVQPGDSVAVFGAGPVGLMAAYSAMLRGASMVLVVDHQSDRLRLAEKIGAIAVDDRQGDPVDQILDHTRGMGTDKGCECVGWQAHDSEGHEHPASTMNNVVRSVRAAGAIGAVGVFVLSDPRSPDTLMRKGEVAFDMGMFFQKGLRIGAGQTSVKAYNRRLRDLIAAGRAQPSFLVSHNLGLDEAPDAYLHFDERADGWTKVVLHP
ncbi:MAG: glutathione-independent formaldehyde dehydrogenase [Micromonosporaceae bacterium]|nr:glutathione-independent formaldehyde dehydrogenase [Micromonosporaceae bacterium]